MANKIPTAALVPTILGNLGCRRFIVETVDAEVHPATDAFIFTPSYVFIFCECKIRKKTDNL